MAFELKGKSKKNEDLYTNETMNGLMNISFNQINSDLFTSLLDDKISKNCKNMFLNRNIVVSDIIYLANNSKEYSGIELNKAYDSIFSLIETIVTELCEKFTIDNELKNKWKINVLTKVTVRTIKGFVYNNIEINNDRIVSLIGSQYPNFEDLKYVHEDNLKISNTNIDLKLLKLELINYMFTEFYMQNNLLRDDPNDLMLIFTVIESEVMKNMNSLIKDTNLRFEDTFIVYRSCLWSALKLFKQCWKNEEDRILEISYSYPVNKITKIKEKYSSSGGFPLEPIFIKFNEMFTTYMNLLEKLDR